MTTTPTTDVAKTHPIVDALATNRRIIMESLPGTLSMERFARLALTTLRRSPDLQHADPDTFIGAVLTAAALGLEIGVAGEAWIVPHKNSIRERVDGRWQTVGKRTEATFILGYQGLVKLFHNHPSAAGISTDWVGEHDTLDYRRGTDPYLTHIPATGDRGEPVAFWARYELTNGFSDFVVLTPEQVRALRGKQVRYDDKGREVRDVADPEHHMSRKTAAKQVLKYAPKSPRLFAALAADEQPGAVQTAHTLSASTLDLGPKAELVNRTTGEITQGRPADGHVSAPDLTEQADPEHAPVPRSETVEGRMVAAPMPAEGDDPWDQ